MLQLVYLGNGEMLRYEPDEADLLATERKVEALWAAIQQRRGDRRLAAQPRPRLCDWCAYKALCPAWGGTPPPLPAPDEVDAPEVVPPGLPDWTDPRLDACRYRHMMACMARAATTSDVFNAIAEPQRREILVLLRAGERPVTELAQELGMTQPGASKHLRVLREVGLVRDRKAGKQRLYGLDARGLRPVHEWTGGFERFWNESFDRLDAYVQDLKQARQEE